jgi:hypothetical protein
MTARCVVTYIIILFMYLSLSILNNIIRDWILIDPSLSNIINHLKRSKKLIAYYLNDPIDVESC